MPWGRPAPGQQDVILAGAPLLPPSSLLPPPPSPLLLRQLAMFSQQSAPTLIEAGQLRPTGELALNTLIYKQDEAARCKPTGLFLARATRGCSSIFKVVFLELQHCVTIYTGSVYRPGTLHNSQLGFSKSTLAFKGAFSGVSRVFMSISWAFTCPKRSVYKAFTGWMLTGLITGYKFLKLV